MSAHRFNVTPVQTTPGHVTVRVFVNGASAGLLTMTHAEALVFADRLTIATPAERRSELGHEAEGRRAARELVEAARDPGEVLEADDQRDCGDAAEWDSPGVRK